MGKHRYVNCVTCHKSIRSDNMKKHLSAHGSAQIRVRGRFAGRAPLPMVPLPVVPLAVAAPLPVAPLPMAAPLPDEAPLAVVATGPNTRRVRSRSPSLSIVPLQHKRYDYLSQQSDVRVSERSQKRKKAILKKF